MKGAALKHVGVPALALLVIAATYFVPSRTPAGEARYQPLVELDSERFIVRPDGSASRVTAISLFDVSGEELLFARVRGRWRCLSHHTAPADGQRIGELVNTIAAAAPLVATPKRDIERWLDGFDLVSGEGRRILLRGPDALKPEASGDVLLELWLGTGGAIRRAVDGVPQPELLRLAGSFDAWFTPPRTLDPNRLPPLVIAQIVPPDWPGHAEGVERVFVDRADGTGFELQRVEAPHLPVNISAWELRESPTVEWRTAHPLLATGFTLFVARATAVTALDPRTVPPEVTERPDVTITYASAAGTILELRIGPRRSDGTRIVVNLDTQTAFELAPRPAELLTPPTSWLEVPGESIPWDPYLR